MQENINNLNIKILCSEVVDTFYTFTSEPTVEEILKVCSSNTYGTNPYVFLENSCLSIEDVKNEELDKVFTVAIIACNGEHILFKDINQTQTLWLINNHKNDEQIYLFKSSSSITVKQYIQKSTKEQLSLMYNPEIASLIISLEGNLFDHLEVQNNLIMVTYEDDSEAELYNAEEFLEYLITLANTLIKGDYDFAKEALVFCISIFKKYLLDKEKDLLDYYKSEFGEYAWENICDWIQANKLDLKFPGDSFISFSDDEYCLFHSFETAEDFLLYILKDNSSERCIPDCNGILGDLMYRQRPVFEEMFGEETWEDIENMLDRQEAALIKDPNTGTLLLVGTESLSMSEVDTFFILDELEKAEGSSNTEQVISNALCVTKSSVQSNVSSKDKIFKHVNFTHYLQVDVANILNKYTENIYIDPFNQLYRVSPGTDDFILSATPVVLKDLLFEAREMLYKLGAQASISDDVALHEMIIEELDTLSQYI